MGRQRWDKADAAVWAAIDQKKQAVRVADSRWQAPPCARAESGSGSAKRASIHDYPALLDRNSDVFLYDSVRIPRSSDHVKTVLQPDLASCPTGQRTTLQSEHRRRMRLHLWICWLHTRRQRESRGKDSRQRLTALNTVVAPSCFCAPLRCRIEMSSSPHADCCVSPHDDCCVSHPSTGPTISPSDQTAQFHHDEKFSVQWI